MYIFIFLCICTYMYMYIHKYVKDAEIILFSLLSFVLFLLFHHNFLIFNIFIYIFFFVFFFSSFFLFSNSILQMITNQYLHNLMNNSETIDIWIKRKKKSKKNRREYFYTDETINGAVFRNILDNSR